MVAAANSNQRLSTYGVGASGIAAICNMNPFASPWDLWLSSTGQAPPIEENEPMEWGNRLEPAIRQKYCDETGALVYVPPESLFHPERSWARATPDGVVVIDDRPAQKSERRNWAHLIQIKNTGYWMAKDWDAGPPVHVQLQEQWELMVTGLQRADVAVLIGGNDYRCYTIHRDDKAIEDLVTIANDFWSKVEKRIEPKVDDSDACKRHFEKRFKRDAVELVADKDTENLFAEWRALEMRVKLDEQRKKTIRNEVRKLMADAGASVVRSTLGDAKLTIPAEPTAKTVVNWKHIAELLGSTKCTPQEFIDLVQTSTSTLTPEPKAPTLYAPRNWSREQ